MEEALGGGITTILAGGTGPAEGSKATTVTPGSWHLARMLEALDHWPLNVALLGKGNTVSAEPVMVVYTTVNAVFSGSNPLAPPPRPLSRRGEVWRRQLGTGSVTDDEIGRPLACVSELRYPQTEFDGVGTMLELAAGGCLATWQGERLRVGR